MHAMPVGPAEVVQKDRVLEQYGNWEIGKRRNRNYGLELRPPRASSAGPGGKMHLVHFAVKK